MSNLPLTQRLSEIKENQLLLMKTRGYQLSDEEERFLEGEEIDLSLNSNYTKKIGKASHETKVYYLYDESDKNAIDGWPKSGKDDIRQIIMKYQKRKLSSTTTLLLIGNNPTSSALAYLADNRSMVDYVIEFWTLEQIIVVPIDHCTVPTHILMKEEDVRNEIPSARQEDAKKAKVFISTMKGLNNDVVARWIGARDGDFVKILRWSNIMDGVIPDYRVVRKSYFDK